MATSEALSGFVLDLGEWSAPSVVTEFNSLQVFTSGWLIIP